MNDWILPLLIAYFAIGLLVYRRTDTSALASTMELRFGAAPLWVVFEYVFFGIVTFWPLWLVARRAR